VVREVKLEVVTEQCPPHGILSYPDEVGWIHVATRSRCIGPDVDRDKRVADQRAAYARSAGRALAQMFEAAPADRPWLGRDFVFALGDYLIARGVSYQEVAHKSHYGVPRCPITGGWCNTCRIGGGNGTGGECAMIETAQHNAAPYPHDSTQKAKLRCESRGRGDHCDHWYTGDKTCCVCGKAPHNADGVTGCTCVPVPDPATGEPIHAYACEIVTTPHNADYEPAGAIPPCGHLGCHLAADQGGPAVCTWPANVARRNAR
jgi:hypothetical protein